MPLISCTFRRSRLPALPHCYALSRSPACCSAPPWPAHALAEKLRVVTTFTIIQDIAQNVAGDAAVVESITKPGAGSTTINLPRATSSRRSTPI